MGAWAGCGELLRERVHQGAGRGRRAGRSQPAAACSSGGRGAGMGGAPPCGVSSSSVAIAVLLRGARIRAGGTLYVVGVWVEMFTRPHDIAYTRRIQTGGDPCESPARGPGSNPPSPGFRVVRERRSANSGGAGRSGQRGAGYDHSVGGRCAGARCFPRSCGWQQPTRGAPSTSCSAGPVSSRARSRSRRAGGRIDVTRGPLVSPSYVVGVCVGMCTRPHASAYTRRIQTGQLHQGTRSGNPVHPGLGSARAAVSMCGRDGAGVAALRGRALRCQGPRGQRRCRRGWGWGRSRP